MSGGCKGHIELPLVLSQHHENVKELSGYCSVRLRGMICSDAHFRTRRVSAGRIGFQPTLARHALMRCAEENTTKQQTTYILPLLDLNLSVMLSFLQLIPGLKWLFRSRQALQVSSEV